MKTFRGYSLTLNGYSPALKNRRILCSALLALALSGTGLSPARAEPASAWPSKPIRLIVPFAAGGGTDIVARLLTAALEPLLGQSIIVEDRPGAQGSIGTRYVAVAAPDGYTMLHGTIGTHSVNQYLYSNLSYDPVKDFIPVTQLTTTTNVLVVSSGSRFKSLGDLIQYAKQNPGKLTYGIPAIGDAAHLGFEQLKFDAGITATGIPYNSVPTTLTDLIGGRTESVTAALQAAYPLITGGKLRPLAVLSAKRSPSLPDVPTVAESGFPGFEASGWQGLFLPAGTDPIIVNKLAAAVAKVYQEPAFQSTMKARGMETASLPPAQFAAFIAGQREKWSKVIRQANIKLE